jgi:serine/threonine protein kinase
VHRVADSGGLLSRQDLKVLAKQMCSTLDSLHGHGIVHQDLSTSNILWDKELRCATLVDFGLARKGLSEANDFLRLAFNPGMRIPVPAQLKLIGTPGYHSPEQLRGDESSYPGDVFALGVVLYEMAMGRPPFAAVRGDVQTHMYPATWDVGFQYDDESEDEEEEDEQENDDEEDHDGVLLRQFIQLCLLPVPESRPSAETLLAHPWLE